MAAGVSYIVTGLMPVDVSSTTRNRATANPVAGCTWHIPSKDEWSQLWPTGEKFSVQNTAITKAGGTGMSDTY